MENFHQQGHFATKNTLSMIQAAGHWWPGMRKDIEHFTRSCIQCQRTNIERAGFHPAKSITADNIWDHIQMDLIGPISGSDNHYKYILTVVDVCSSYTVIRPLLDNEASTVATELHSILCTFGPPKILQSDNGPEFKNNLLEQLTKLFSVGRRWSTPYKPNTNGAVERKNQDIEKMLHKLTNNVMNKWESYLPEIERCLNNAFNERTATTPFALMFGRSPNDLVDHRQVQQSVSNSTTQVQQHWNNFKLNVLPAINKRTAIYKEKQENQLNQRNLVAPLLPGSFVMAKNFTRKNKWEDHYIGPFEIVRQNHGGAYVLLDSDGQPMNGQFTIEQLKPWSRHHKIGQQSKQDIKPTVNYEEMAEVDRILNHETQSDGSNRYLVRWKDSTEDWINADQFHSNRPINNYWKKLKRSSTSTKSKPKSKTVPHKKQQPTQTSGTTLSSDLGGSDVTVSRYGRKILRKNLDI
jgi:transposase InsO family protein